MVFGGTPSDNARYRRIWRFVMYPTVATIPSNARPIRARNAFVLHGMGLLLLFALAARAQAATDSGFVYHIPDGWIDLVKADSKPANLAQPIFDEARNGQYLIYAVDPDRLTATTAPVNMNVKEAPGSRRVTKAALEEVRQGVLGEIAKVGIKANSVGEPIIRDLNGVDIGILDFLFEAPGVRFRVRQYAIPGERHMAILSFAVPESLFPEYQSIIDASAMATGGAKKSGGFGPLAYVGFAGLIGAAIGAVIAITRSFSSKKTAPVAAGRAPTAATPTPTQSIWYCPTCKRRVPASVGQCRCGTMRA
jgi:hypothetical protein